MNQTAQIQTLHQQYIDESGMNLPLNRGHFLPWEAFIARGHTADDLRVVIKALKRGIEHHERNLGCLRFRNLLGDIDAFAEELAMARKVLRPKPAYTPQKSQVLRATGRADEPAGKAPEPVAAVVERIKLADMLRQWKTTNPI